ncbi:MULTISPECIES: hypothetical protein [unclassified Haematospirillum]|uniref:hypothetical protein n=1 Tax=unclassified Haematospirillum TaxID=2622088 RepID=UPI00143901D9|nr:MULTISPECIES: hypothetical protein [unclassified Haematospirillum]NKD54088.1 hypothetical protein [Haematospirillum sp. H4890]NKD74133.1 hypothetical protein [Haematospirillum sp. H4485]
MSHSEDVCRSCDTLRPYWYRGDYYIHRVRVVLDGTWELGIFLGGVQSNMIRIALFSAAVGPAARRDTYVIQDDLQCGTFFRFVALSVINPEPWLSRMGSVRQKLASAHELVC